jgi:hypothetical protein
MTACATLIPTKVDAATLTITPTVEIQTNPGDLVEFTFVLTPAPSSIVRFKSFDFVYDSSELSLSPTGEFTYQTNGLINNTTTVLTRTFTVITPVKDGISDLIGSILYDESGPLGESTDLIISASGADVITPEPLTMFGAAAALGYGVIFKRKYSKKTKS